MISLALYVLVKVSCDLYAGSLFIKMMIPGISSFVAVTVLLLVTSIYVVTGGLQARLAVFFLARQAV